MAVIMSSLEPAAPARPPVPPPPRPLPLSRFDLILAGDDVSKKKPDPLIYNMGELASHIVCITSWNIT